MWFQIISAPGSVQTIAVGRRIRILKLLTRRYGRGNWLKKKGIARIRLADGTTRVAEVHWYEAAGIGRRRFKIKRILD
ncbi:MAG: hypothetical protein HY700_06420 [Gemmatimonadetes bacterium]|nr:hypothetical protein [Gemmatimonadota bacterium]